jgi:hypothetical protein
MAKQLDPKITEKLKQYGFDRSACWDCHGTWVIYHNVLEKIAAQEGIIFSKPDVICKEPTNVVIWYEGKLGNLTADSFGEANPKNNKNAYPYAMAEKRAKDRVILKLVGFSGLVYSEEEAYDLKASGKSVWQAPDEAELPDYSDIVEIERLIKETGTDVARFCDYMEVPAVSEIKDTEKALTALRQKAKQ